MADWKSRYEGYKKRRENQDDRMNDLVLGFVNSFSGYVGAGLMGFLHGRRGGLPAVGGLPVDALVGGIGGLAGMALTYFGYTAIGGAVGGFAGGSGNYWFGCQMADLGQDKREEAGELLNRQFTTEEAQKEGVQSRRPIFAGDTVVPMQRFVYAEANRHAA